MKEKKIALLFFSRNAAVEGRKKAWFSAGSIRKNQLLASSLIAHTHQALMNSGLPVFHFHEGNQRGRTFGEKLANAYQDLFDLDFAAVIAVGNDTPEIQGIDWKYLVSELKRGRCVIGPTFRRGAYLIGMTAAAFDRQAFAELPWQSGELLQALSAFCNSSAKAPVFLTCLRDINTGKDVGKILISPLLGDFLKRLLLLLLYGAATAVARVKFILRPSLFLLGGAHFRAPPVILFPLR